MDGKEGCAFDLPLDVDKPAPGECLQHAFEGGDGDMGETGEVLVAESTAGGVFRSPVPLVDKEFAAAP